MLDHLQQTIQRFANGRTILVLFCIFILGFVTLNFADIPFGLRALTAHAGGLMILDMRAGYTPDEAFALLDALGAPGRQVYGTMLLAADFLFPLAYTLVFATATAWLLRRVVGPEHPARRLSLVPFAALIGDWGENICFLAMLTAYPTRLDGMVRIANLLTLLKFGAGIVGIPFLAICMMILAWRKVGRKSEPESAGR